MMWGSHTSENIHGCPGNVTCGHPKGEGRHEDARYGILERCKELVEAGYDVRQPDKENVTLLHWAAINNRLDLVKFYISKGAVVDQLGGDLNSTPLHWAIRQGHLSMVILLLNCGADPTLIDGEGYSSIHLAVVFQHMPIIAYLISKGQSVDTTDFSGQTPLMLSAQKVIGHGCFQNLADFFQCSCFGMFKPNVVDWTKQYTLTFHPAKGKNVHSV
ncbi:Palmitoyltransferase ZDHHC13 [Chelonia mydas]|uniref:Palmitoyltransferase ZDHHC13 n=1 Tax=Chelonia mydas TaxID=8469 RepID=M7AS18_CHEMY|nr:Palmitoyltransferase ZDHHC13 [Chelonia mydas]